MATYRARLVHEADGSWTAASVEIPNTWSRGRTSEEAIEKLRGEIRYRIELCPCSGVADDFVQIDVQPTKSSREAERVPRVAPPLVPAVAQAPVATWRAARPAAPATFRGIAGCPPVRGAPPLEPPAAPTPPPIRQRRQSRWPD